jgi:hypothetical protein
MELTPSNRVLSGESIVFQNEMLEIFKDIILKSTHPIEELMENKKEEKVLQPGHLKPRYIISIILEFLRTLLENSIP